MAGGMTGPGHQPELLVLDSAAQAAEAVGRRIGAELAAGRAAVLGLATGATMRPVYAWLAQAGVSLRCATTFNLDEYVGLAPGHPASFAFFMREHLFSRVEHDPCRIFLLDGLAPDLEAEAARYEAAIHAAGGIGLQLLGIGRNGHIGFNEPGAPFNSATRAVTLAPSTRAANQQDFPPGEPVPAQALTVGIGTILRSREIVLLATGPAKAAAVAAALTGPPGPHCPASALRLHPSVLVVCDRDAASGLGPRASEGAE